MLVDAVDLRRKGDVPGCWPGGASAPQADWRSMLAVEVLKTSAADGETWRKVGDC
jgi:hypothetical protein